MAVKMSKTSVRVMARFFSSKLDIHILNDLSEDEVKHSYEQLGEKRLSTKRLTQAGGRDYRLIRFRLTEGDMMH